MYRLHIAAVLGNFYLKEQATFFECCKGTFYDNFFTVAVSTGLRIGELAALEPEDIDFENKVIKVRKTLLFQILSDENEKEFRFGPPKTDTSVRDVPITKQCEMALKRQILQKAVVAAKSPYKVDEEFKNLLFVSQHNTPLYPQVIIDAIKRIVREINLTRDVIVGNEEDGIKKIGDYVEA